MKESEFLKTREIKNAYPHDRDVVKLRRRCLIEHIDQSDLDWIGPLSGNQFNGIFDLKRRQTGIWKHHRSRILQCRSNRGWSISTSHKEDTSRSYL